MVDRAGLDRFLPGLKAGTSPPVTRVMFKQLLAAGGVDVVQLDATRVGGVNECVTVLLLAAKYGVPVCPHAGGVDLCELVQHRYLPPERPGYSAQMRAESLTAYTFPDGPVRADASQPEGHGEGATH